MATIGASEDRLGLISTSLMFTGETLSNCRSSNWSTTNRRGLRYVSTSCRFPLKAAPTDAPRRRRAVLVFSFRNCDIGFHPQKRNDSAPVIFNHAPAQSDRF